MPYKAPLGGLLGYGLLVFGAGLIVSGIFTRGARYEIAVGLVILAIGYSFSRAVLRLDPHLPETLKDLIQPFHAGGNVYNRNAILQELETALAVNHRREPAVVLAEIEAKLESAKERCVSFEAFKWPLIG